MLSMRSHTASSPLSDIAATLHRHWCDARRACAAAGGVMAVWVFIFLLTIFAWLPAMHARTHALQHAAGVACSHAGDHATGSCHASGNTAHGESTIAATTTHGVPVRIPAPAEDDCDICAQLLLALLCGAVPSLDPPLPGVTLAERITITRESVSARDLAHLPPSRGPPMI